MKLKKIMFMLKFTMVELLVVISIITILAAILLPALQKSQAIGKRIKCSGAMKQLGMCSSYYQGDNSDFVVPCYWYTSPCANYPDKFTDNSFKSFWFSYMAIYAPQLFTRASLKNTACIPMCDEAYKEQGMTIYDGTALNFNATASHGAYGYPQPLGYRNSTAVAFPLCKTTSIKKPAGTLLLIDSYLNNINPWQNYWVNVRALRHLKTANVLFNDGHVSSSKFSDPELNFRP